MTHYAVAFNRETKVATILNEGSPAPDGSEMVGRFNASAVSPNPTDASTQHVLNMLYRHGIEDTTGVTVVRGEPGDVLTEADAGVMSTGNANLDPPGGSGEGTEPGKETAQPQTSELAVGDFIDLVDGTTKGMEFDVSDEEIVKLDKRNGKVSALKAGTATVTVKDKDGNTNQVVITVREPAAPAGETGSGEGSGADAKEAITA
jgi:hypothetical protein